MTHLLRAIAVAIAVAAAIDPAIAVTRAVPARIAIVVAEPGRIDAERVRARLTSDLSADFDVVPYATSDARAAVLIGTSYVASSLAAGPAAASGVSRIPSISTVTLPTPDIAITNVVAPREVPPATTVRIECDVDAGHAIGQSTDLVARVGGLDLARVTHRWTRASERWRAVVDVVPFGEPPLVVSLIAGAAAADVVVDRRTSPIRVLAYDARPSWAATFTRRALESDRRFQVDSRVASSRGIAARTADAASLTDLAVDAFDVVLAGGLDALSSADVRALDRFMRARGGAVVLVPDQRVARGAAADLVSGGAERLLEHPSTLTMARKVAPLQASELWLQGPPAPPDDVVAATAGADPRPVIVTAAHGAGRLLVSGAMDAWRFRAADDRAFDRFWQATVAGLALAVPPPVDVDVVPSPLRPGERGEVVVRARHADPRARVSASAGDRPLRLWPDAERGVYRGEVIAAATPGRAVVRATVADGGRQSAARIVPVIAGARRSSGDAPPLALLASAHGGIDVPPDRLVDLERVVRERVPAARARVPAHPLRSPWWLAPFAACLAGEWWLRRRRGLR
jgi:hypothetical protein